MVPWPTAALLIVSEYSEVECKFGTSVAYKKQHFLVAKSKSVGYIFGETSCGHPVLTIALLARR